ncbi:concanavalin A-like lectin/glucanase domain-containing protein [Gigaspora rosea]|uniref:Concanavalin A-like lectin/glucanase domain-containing protein n=1 Tax=Gigaspora rosea TaxID=44941 RepID=A0A397UT34_9GLOM|nr:concanavalin A-like lectin/glucanase domain-containing protein [Gigaspora rosea]
MGDLDLKTSYNDIVLPTAWDIKDKSPFIDIDSSGLKVNYTADHPVPSECGIFYFEIEIINKGKNGMIGVGYCTKQGDKKIDDSNYINNMLLPGQENKENESWGCGYHGDDGYSFYSGSGGPYDLSYPFGYTTGDIIGCYLNFRNEIVFYTKNGINLGIACQLHSNLKGILYPCVGFRSQGGTVKVNFGNENFKYSVMTNEDINKKSKNALILEYQEKVYFIVDEYETMFVSLIEDLTKSLEKKTNNAFELSYREKLYFIMGKYDEASEDLTRLLEIEPDNTIALRYRVEINYIMKRYNESIADLEKLNEIILKKLSVRSK